MVAAGVPRGEIDPSRDQASRATYMEEMVILNARIEKVKWADDNPPTVIVNTANLRHAHGAGVAKAIADMYPEDVLEHMQQIKLPALPHTTTFHPVSLGAGPIKNVRGIIHHAWSRMDSLNDKSMDNIRYHLHLSYGGPYMVITALRHIQPKFKGQRFEGEQIVMTLHGAGVYEYPWEDAARACTVWSRNLILMGLRVVILIRSKKETDRFKKIWKDFVASERVFETTQAEREAKDAAEAIFWVSQVGAPDTMAIKEIWAIRQGLNPVSITYGSEKGERVSPKKIPLKAAGGPDATVGLYPDLSGCEEEDVALREARAPPSAPLAPREEEKDMEGPPPMTPARLDFPSPYLDQGLSRFTLGEHDFKGFEENAERQIYSVPQPGRFNVTYAGGPKIPKVIPPYNTK